jgi:Holliday junction resolvase
MLQAQVDPVQVSSLGAFAEKFGFPALLVVVLLFGMWKLFQAAREERKEMLDSSKAERKEDRDAHLGALGKHTEVVAQLGAGLTRLETKVDNLDRDVTSLKTRTG